MKTKRSDKRKRNHGSYVRLNDEEHNTLKSKVDNSDASSIPDLLRQAALGVKIRSTTDKVTHLRLLQLKGDLGRIGGLIKLQIGSIKLTGNHPDLDELRNKILEVQKEVKQLANQLK